MRPTHNDVRELIAGNPGQGSFDEYARVLDTILSRRPAKLLIFGVGKDSKLWFRANAGGRTVFVEHEPSWVARTRSELPEAEVIQVKYRTYRWLWRLMLPFGALLRMRDLPASVWNERWDVIFVDSPQGGRWSRAGRMKSLYTAALLAQRSDNVDLLAHDCHRRVEQVYCDRFLGDEQLVGKFNTLRHYRVAQARPS